MIRAILALVVFASFAAFAQQAAAPLQFEVASIKPSAPIDPSKRQPVGIRLMPGGTVEMRFVNLRMLIQQAYDVRDFQISGGPAWLNSERYDITAKTGDTAGDVPADPRQVSDEQRKTYMEQMRQRLQALLEERFQLKVHRETKELPVYALVVAKNGPKLKEDAGANASAGRGMMRMGRGQLAGQQVGMAFLTQALSQQLGRTVLDQTGLKGSYDFELNFTPEPGQGGGVFGGPGGGPGPLPPPPGAGPGFKEPPPPDPNGPTIFTAVQEQLGLKLESQKGPVDIIVIDHVEKASEN